MNASLTKVSGLPHSPIPPPTSASFTGLSNATALCEEQIAPLFPAGSLWGRESGGLPSRVSVLARAGGDGQIQTADISETGRSKKKGQEREQEITLPNR